MSEPRRSGEQAVLYRERLGPSLWLLVAAALCGPMAALVFTPVDATVALTVGAGVAALVVVLLVAASPVVEVGGDGMLRAGRARIEVRHLGDAQGFTGDEARRKRGVDLHPRAWHLIRGGIDPVVVIPLEDPDDPVPSWVISTRTPDRLIAAIDRARRGDAEPVTPRTPGRSVRRRPRGPAGSGA